MHQAVTARQSYRDGRHWSHGDLAVQHPGRLADCALCLLEDDPELRVAGGSVSREAQAR